MAAKRNTVRYTIELSEKNDAVLDRLATDLRISKAEVLRRALASFSFLEAEERKGHTVVVMDKEKEKIEKELLFLTY